MRTSRIRISTALIAVAGLTFVPGCGSERKPEAAPKATQGASQRRPAPNDVLPRQYPDSEARSRLIAEENQKAVAEQREKSVAQAGPKTAPEARPKMAADGEPKTGDQATSKMSDPVRPRLMSKAIAPPKASAKAMPPSMAAPPPPPAAQYNPVRSDNLSADQKASDSLAIPPDQSGAGTSKFMLMRETDTAGEARASAPGAPLSTHDGVKTAPAQAADAQGEYTVVKVFYGTDRAPLDALVPAQAAFLTWLLRTVFIGMATLFFALLGFWAFPSRILRATTYCGMFALGALAMMTIFALFKAPWIPGSPKTPAPELRFYGAERGKLELGVCEVSIPKSHQVGELESPSVLRLEFCEDPARHVMLASVKNQSAEQFFAELRQCVGRSSRKSAFVFIHGYNVTFADAARRTAQMAYDLKFDGAPIFFSWPSQGELLQYAVDETNIDWTAPHLRQFLTDVAKQSAARQIHLIAHSMGNRALTSVLRNLAAARESLEPMFNEVILTAPDIDAEVFATEIAPAVVKTAKRVTLYASSNDEALIVSKKVHGYPRAGDSGSQLVVVPGVDTVDVSAVDTSLLGHNYYGDNRSVLADIFELLHDSRPADERHWLRPQRLGMMKYWVFQQSL